MPEFDKPDKAKARINRIKHGITFEQAKTIWERPLVIEDDDRFDYDEERMKAVGLLRNLTCVVVIYTERQGKIRIISARVASPQEREAYYEQSGYGTDG